MSRSSSYFQYSMQIGFNMKEGAQILPSLSSWAYKGITDPEFVAVSSVPVATNSHLDNDYIHGSSILSYPPMYTSSLHGVQLMDKDQTYYGESNERFGDAELVYVAPDAITDGPMHVVSTSEYCERPSASAPPSSELYSATHPSSQIAWESESSHLALQDALFENSCWQSAFLSREDENAATSEDHDPVKKLTGQQRIAANRRERRRMNTINQAFETLRMHLPILECERKLSKADTLRVAADYIKFMSHILETTAPKRAEYGGRGDMLMITRKIKPDPNKAVDTTGYSEESSVSVLLTWSRNVKCDNSIIKNGRKKIRAPIWNPEFPIKEHTNSKRMLKPNSYSLGQLFVEDSCEEPAKKMLRMENFSVIDDRYVFSLGSQRQENIYIHPSDRDTAVIHQYGPGGEVGEFHTPRYTNYLQPIPEVSSQDDRLYQYYDATAIQSKAIYVQDVPWHPCKHSPHSVELSPINNMSRMERVDHDRCMRQDRLYNGDFSGNEFRQVVFPSHHFYQTHNIQGRDITAL